MHFASSLSSRLQKKCVQLVILSLHDRVSQGIRLRHDDFYRSSLRIARSTGASMQNSPVPTIAFVRTKQDAAYVFYELTRIICPNCRRVIDAEILLSETKVCMRKGC